MYQKIKAVQLKNGEAAELGVVTGPDNSELGTKLRSLLGHKGGVWQWQIEQSLSAAHTGVESRFYILSQSGVPFANIMTVENRGVGIFGHVYTHPLQRRKGAAEIIHSYQMEDFKQRGGRALFLGTGFGSAAYQIYSRHGFQSVEPGSDYMHWFRDSRKEFETGAFAPGAVRHERLSYAHWPVLPALAMMDHPARVRIAGMDVINARSTEGGSLEVLSAINGHPQDRRVAGSDAFVAVSEQSGVPVAIASSKPDPLFWESVDVVDLFCASGFEIHLPVLFQKLSMAPERRAICYADACWPEKREILSACGFLRAAGLPNYVKGLNTLHSAELWIKN